MPKEGRFYVEYLGWKETRGLYGSENTDPIVSKLLTRQKSTRQLHRMTIKINGDDLQVSQEKSDQGKTKKIKYPPQPMCDVSYVSQCAPPNTDVVCCIFLGYNMYTQCAAHVHSYRFDSPDTATIFVKLVNSYIERPEFRQRIIAMESDLVDLGHVSSRGSPRTSRNLPLSINPDIGSDAGSLGSHSPNSSDSGFPRSYGTAAEELKQRKDIIIKRTPSQKEKQPTAKLFTTIQDELQHKLNLQQEKEAPILLPPKDYDTMVRRHGHLSIRAKVVTNKPYSSIMGPGSIFEDRSKAKPGDGNNNQQTRQRASGGYILQKSQSSSIDDDADSASSNHSAEEPSVFGLYKGLKKQDSFNSAQDMVMWSPEFSFGHESSSTMSSGFHSSSGSQGLRRMKATAGSGKR